MSTGVAAIALFAPMVASNAIFSARRAKRGAEAIDENPLYALTNFDIAAAQILKVSRAAKGLAAVAPVAESTGFSAAEAIKQTQTAEKTLSKLGKVGKVINFTADHVNPIICVAGGLKVLGAEDKTDAAAREILSLGSMFLAEGAAKKILGMPKTTRDKNGKLIHQTRESILAKHSGKFQNAYENVFNSNQRKAIADFAKTKNFVKYLPGATKGLLFVGASIAGYALGEKLGNKILGERKES